MYHSGRHGDPLTDQECVRTMLAYYDRLAREGIERQIAARLCANHFGIRGTNPVSKVLHFVDERERTGSTNGLSTIERVVA